jgi:adenosylcobyric acid synthase
MVQGCTSDAGKSTLVAGLCRLLARQGFSIAPFKPQNMALNAAVTSDGGEIGRAQALQALACGLEAHSDMNPVLLKPTSDRKAQVIIQGKSIGHLDALDYHAYKATARTAVLDSWQRLTQQYRLCLVEGAGSPAEINLREGDIANMGFAEAVDIPVILIADIDKGGVFAHIVGTLALLSESEQARIKGFVINRFRGDIALLQSGLDWLEAKTGKPVLGVLPYIMELKLDEEDAVRPNQSDNQHAQLKIRILRLPHISNHTDFAPLFNDPRCDVDYLAMDAAAINADVLILPGSKAVMSDLSQLVEQGWRDKLIQHLRYGGKVLAVCGGFQMLGRNLLDPKLIEGDKRQMQGLGFFDMTTRWQSEKHLNQQAGILWTGEAMSGYEMHQGMSSGNALSRPFAILNHGKTDGAISEDGHIIGTYLHGLFDQPTAYGALLAWMGLPADDNLNHQSHEQQQCAELDRLADVLAERLDMGKVMGLLT